jgi:hypothetical protein
LERADKAAPYAVLSGYPQGIDFSPCGSNPDGLTRRKIGMRRMTCWLLFSSAICLTPLDNPGDCSATPAVGFSATTVLRGTFGEMDILNKSIIPDSSDDDRRAKAWLSEQKTTGPAELYVQSNVWQPGGSTGWHTHPGRSLIIVTAGTVTEYDGPDLHCEPHVYTTNTAFVDPRDGHAHIIRNEGKVVARTTAIQLIPAGAARRIDVADPGNCHF